MSVLILSEHDVRALLDMEACVAAMEDVLARLARGELTNPLRTLMAPPGPAAMGLMPAHAAGDAPVFALKEIVVVPTNPQHGLDPHQGSVILHDGGTGQLIAVLNASPITEIRTAAVSAVATKLLARPGARTVAVLGSGVQGRSHVDAMQTVLDDPIIRIWSRNPAHAEALALETHSLVAGSVAEALDGADVVCTATSASDPFVELEWLAPGTHINAAGAFPNGKSRELSSATVAAARFFVDRRESTINESGDYRVAAAEQGFGPDHIVAELGELLSGDREGRRSSDELTVVQVDGYRRRGSRRCPAVRGAGPGARHRRRGRVLIPLAAIEAARERIADFAIRTPLVRLQVPESPAEIWLKLECLQPIGSFKIRGAANAIRSASPGAIANGVLTTSAGNMAQGVAWIAHEEGVPATVVAPDHAPQTKLDAITRLGGTVIKVPFERWWQAMEEGSYPGVEGYFVHPVLDDAVMAGNGTIGLELVEQLDAIDTVLVPWGGGGLTTGIASALAALSPATRVLACEPETGAPLAASLAAGEPVGVDYTASFVDGAGGKSLLPAMWEQARPLLAGAATVTLDETAAAVRLLAERARVVAEGAGALSVAAAMSGRRG